MSEALSDSSLTPEVAAVPMWERMGGEASGKIRINLDAPVHLPFKDAEPAWRWGRQSGLVETERRGNDLYVGGERFDHCDELHYSFSLYAQRCDPDRLLKYEQDARFHPNVLDSCAEAGLIPVRFFQDRHHNGVLVAHFNGFYRANDRRTCYVRCVEFMEGLGGWRRTYYSLQLEWHFGGFVDPRG